MKNDRINEIHNDYTAQSKDDILFYLKEQNIAIPARTAGRTTQRRERQAGLRLLATWATGDRLTYPLRIVHQDKPDFLLCYDDHDIGVEITEAVSQEWAATDALAEQMSNEEMGIEEGESCLLFEDHFKRGTPKRTADQRRELIKNQPSGQGWGDFGMDREWADFMMDCIVRKTAALSKPSFAKYKENFLLIYDNLPVFRFPRPQPIDYLTEKLKAYFAKQSRYDGILIDSHGELLEFYPCRHESHQIVDLRSQHEGPQD
jgi:hypothetical protein